ncbi:MAG TPA: hypothetical protein VII51_08875 [Gaiellaceae bacterium]
MSVFRATARTTDPDGREWEIYAYRIALPRRGPVEPWVDDITPGDSRGYLLAFPFVLAGAVARALVRLVDIPVAATRALRSKEWTVEAITYGPHRESHSWKTTAEFRGQVLASVEGSLANGHFPRPPNARFLG